MLIKLETVNVETSEIVATDYIVTDSPQRAMAMIQEADGEDVKYHICDEDEARAFWASQMGKATSPRKAETSAFNGRKGGRRPRKVING